MNIDDQELTRRAAGGDEHAFAALCERHGPALRRYLQFRLGNAHDADDAFQNTLISAWRATGSKRPDGNTVAWLFSIARNEANSQLRSRRVSVELTEATAGTVGGVHEQALARAELSQTLSDIATLPETQRGALVLRELHGLEYSEIAAALVTTPAAARRAVCDAREALVHSAAARELGCQTIRERLADGDRRRLRARTVRMHLRSCQQCRDYGRRMHARPEPVRSVVCVFPAVVATKGSLTGAGLKFLAARWLATALVAGAASVQTHVTGAHETRAATRRPDTSSQVRAAQHLPCMAQATTGAIQCRL
jgi:RNA polymerase sigma factor (sigma-70 family)